MKAYAVLFAKLVFLLLLLMVIATGITWLAIVISELIWSATITRMET